MLEDYLAQQPTAIWNNARGVWEKPTGNLFCEHWELYSETWQIEGTMRNGQAFALPTQVRHTEDLESSFLRTPTASQGEGGALGEEEARKRGNTVGIRDNAMDLAALNGHKVTRSDLLPTVRAQNGENRNNKIWARDESKPQNLENALALTLLPTPNTMDMLPARDPSKIDKSKGGHANVRETVVNQLLPTVTTQDASNTAGPSQFERNTLPLNAQVMETNWGKFEPAIRRWEEVLGRLAPAPTKPDGKDGAHRLSSAFTEWMMGLPEGWITDCGLTRNEELKACGNGVVPQQAALALTILKERMLNATN